MRRQYGFDLFCAVVLVLLVSLLASPGFAQSSPAEAPAGPAKKDAEAKPLSPEQRAWSVLQSAATDHRSAHRENALAAASALPAWPRTVKLLVSGLHDKDSDVRRVAATSLGEIKAHAAVSVLRSALDDDDPSVRFAVAQALWKMGDRSGRRVLLDVLERNQPAAAGGLGAMIKSGLGDADSKLHDPAQLAFLGINEASGAFLGPFSIGVNFAEQLAKDKSAPARVISASILAKDRDPRSIRDLDEALDDSNWAVQAAAAKALGSHSCRILISDLNSLLDEKRDEVKLTAATSLLRISAAVNHDRADGAECSLLHGAHSQPSLQAAAR